MKTVDGTLLQRNRAMELRLQTLPNDPVTFEQILHGEHYFVTRLKTAAQTKGE
jgi:hypothetical protein